MEKADLQDLFDIFSKDIFFKKLYAEADASNKKTLVSEQDGIYIGSLWTCGRIMVTVSMGEEGASNYIQFTCMASSDDPHDLFVRSHNGDYYQLLVMLQTAAKRFRTEETVMKPKSLTYAGVVIG